MSAIPAIMYIGGLFVFGFAWWILNAVKEVVDDISVRGSTFDILNYFWIGVLIVYLLFGGIWLIRTYNEKQYTRF